MITLSRNGAKIQAPQGFSWTTLFFGFFPALFRGDLLGAIIIFFLIIFTGGIALFIIPFFYNSVYINGLVNRGWVKVEN